MQCRNFSQQINMKFQNRSGDTSTSLIVLGLTIIGFALAFFLLNSSDKSIEETRDLLSHGAAERLRNAALFLAIMPGKGYTLLNFEIPVYPKVVGAFPDQQLHVGVLEFKNLDNHPGSKKLPASVLDRSYEYALDFPVTQYDEISSWC